MKISVPSPANELQGLRCFGNIMKIRTFLITNLKYETKRIVYTKIGAKILKLTAVKHKRIDTSLSARI